MENRNYKNNNQRQIKLIFKTFRTSTTERKYKITKKSPCHILYCTGRSDN